jgi:lysophospholipase L1-like esterase
MRILRALIAAVCLASVFAQQAPFFLKDGDTVVFYGDSITDQRLYTTFVETYVVTRYPQMNVKFVHSGWGGDRVTGGGGGRIDVRLQRDVIAYKPTVMTIMLGMNDGRYGAFDQETFDTFANGYKYIVKTVKSALPGVRITAIQPSPYDDVTKAPLFPGGYNAVLVRYGEFIKDLGNAEHLSVADLNTPVVQELAKAQSLDPKAGDTLIRDRVHPGAGGHLLMAKALLKAWGAPAVVTDVEIDSKSATATRTDNTTVSATSKEGGLSWDQLDRALPMPLDFKDAGVALAVRSSDVERTLDQEILRVTGLAPGRYRVSIDGEEVDSFTAAQLADGINLAMLPTPMSRQAADVHALTVRHNNIHFARWRSVQVPLEKEDVPHKQAAMDALDQLENDLVLKQRVTAQPKVHHYRLVAVSD